MAFAPSCMTAGARDRRVICTPRRNSPARSCWRPARRRIFEFARVFRNRERGPLHHPEFTMLEWYRAHGPTSSLMDDCMALLALRRRHGRRRRFSFREPQRRSVRRAGAPDGRGSVRAPCRHRSAGHADGRPGRTADCLPPLAHAGRRPDGADDDTWGDIFSRVLVGEDRAAARHRPRDDALRISGRRVGAGAAEDARSARGRALRALCLRRRARQRLRRTHRCRPSSAGA